MKQWSNSHISVLVGTRACTAHFLEEIRVAAQVQAGGRSRGILTGHCILRWSIVIAFYKRSAFCTVEIFVSKGWGIPGDLAMSLWVASPVCQVSETDVPEPTRLVPPLTRLCVSSFDAPVRSAGGRTCRGPAWPR